MYCGRMIKMTISMTGFGRAVTSEESRYNFTIEIKSVNHRYLDLNIKMPRNLLSLENKIRETVKEKISRGKLDVFITQNTYEKDDLEVSFNKILGDSYFNVLKEIGNRYEINDDISVSLIAKFPDVVTLEKKDVELEEVWNSLKIPLNEAIDVLIKMRTDEGTKLTEDIILKCNIIEELVNGIKERSPLVVEEYKNKLNNRLKELIENSTIDEGRMYAEIAIFADKASIDEEIVRLNSHIIQLKENLNKQESVGRKLDFIVQEMNREANTISSKANDLEIVNLAINIKNYIEKIREQVQNIE